MDRWSQQCPTPRNDYRAKQCCQQVQPISKGQQKQEIGSCSFQHSPLARSCLREVPIAIAYLTKDHYALRRPGRKLARCHWPNRHPPRRSTDQSSCSSSFDRERCQSVHLCNGPGTSRVWPDFNVRCFTARMSPGFKMSLAGPMRFKLPWNDVHRLHASQWL